MDVININKYVYFDTADCWFKMTNEGSELIYRTKQVICSYSGANEWCNHFFCEMLDLFSGHSVYNHSLGSFRHKEEIEYLCREGRSEEVVKWVDKHKGDEWFERAADTFVMIIDSLPEY